MSEVKHEVLLQAKGIYKNFETSKKDQAVHALTNVDLTLYRGETLALVGESGCGKSTLGRTLIRLIPATDGHVYLDGEDISGLKGKALKQMRKKAQIIFQVLHGLGERGLGDPQLFRGPAVVEGLGQL